MNGPRPTFGGVEAGPVSAVSDGSGVARARYWAPFRTDQENDTTVQITGREASTNFANQTFRNVTIFLRAANRPSFPGGACFMIEPLDTAYAVGDVINFTATQVTGGAGHPIARYEWDFGDGSGRVEGRNQSHIFTSAGDPDATEPSSFTVTLFLTESVSGAQTSCTADVVVTTSGSPPPPACTAPTASFTTSAICASGDILADDVQVTRFDASTSTSGDPAETITSYSWSFGDGSSGSGRTTTNVYPSTLVGFSATVTLTVRNSCGATATTATSFSMVDPCP